MPNFFSYLESRPSWIVCLSAWLILMMVFLGGVFFERNFLSTRSAEEQVIWNSNFQVAQQNFPSIRSVGDAKATNRSSLVEVIDRLELKSDSKLESMKHELRGMIDSSKSVSGPGDLDLEITPDLDTKLSKFRTAIVIGAVKRGIKL